LLLVGDIFELKWNVKKNKAVKYEKHEKALTNRYSSSRSLQ
jgi:hypothetical protein